MLELPGSRDPPGSPPAVTRRPLRALSIVGAGLGLAIFAVVALVPSLLYGGQTGFRLAGGVFGAPVASTPLVSAMVILGIVLSTAAGAALFAVVGALGGAGIAVLTRAGGRPGPVRRDAP